MPRRTTRVCTELSASEVQRTASAARHLTIDHPNHAWSIHHENGTRTSQSLTATPTDEEAPPKENAVDSGRDRAKSEQAIPEASPLLL
jgi:hypothetical protein